MPASGRQTVRRGGEEIQGNRSHGLAVLAVLVLALAGVGALALAVRRA